MSPVTTRLWSGVYAAVRVGLVDGVKVVSRRRCLTDHTLTSWVRWLVSSTVVPSGLHTVDQTGPSGLSGGPVGRRVAASIRWTPSSAEIAMVRPSGLKLA